MQLFYYFIFLPSSAFVTVLLSPSLCLPPHLCESLFKRLHTAQQARFCFCFSERLLPALSLSIPVNHRSASSLQPGLGMPVSRPHQRAPFYSGSPCPHSRSVTAQSTLFRFFFFFCRLFILFPLRFVLFRFLCLRADSCTPGLREALLYFSHLP